MDGGKVLLFQAGRSDPLQVQKMVPISATRNPIGVPSAVRLRVPMSCHSTVPMSKSFMSVAWQRWVRELAGQLAWS